MRISDWSSDVCSSDLRGNAPARCRLARHRGAGGRGSRRPVGCGPPAHATAAVARDGRCLAVLRSRGRRNALRHLPRHPVLPPEQIGRAHLSTPVTNAPLVCRLLLDKKKHYISNHTIKVPISTTTQHYFPIITPIFITLHISNYYATT